MIRLYKLLTENGYRVAVLTATVAPNKREEWVEKQVADGVQVLITNPSLVETGLDLNDFTTLYYYNIAYNLFTLRQSSRRSWRINQRAPRIEVYFNYYEGTMQHRAIRLMASKLAVIPMDLMMRIVSFFRYYTSNGNEQEVLVNIYWDKRNREYVMDAPEQTVSKASIESIENLDYADERYIHYMDIHSHNSMKALFSSVDDKDEKSTRLYSVIGRLDKYFPDIKTRISNGGKFWEIDPGEVFELVAKPFPSDWKSKVHFRAHHEIDKDGETL